ncbi:MAG: PilN domain-containing protein [Pseudomonadota bacterium]
MTENNTTDFAQAMTRPSISAVWGQVRNVLVHGLSELNGQSRNFEQPLENRIEFRDETVFLIRKDDPYPIPLSPLMIKEFAEDFENPEIDIVFGGNACIDLIFPLPTRPLDEMRAMIESEMWFRAPFSAESAKSMWIAKEVPSQGWQVQAAVILNDPLDKWLKRLSASGVTVRSMWREAGEKSFCAVPTWLNDANETPSTVSLLKAMPHLPKCCLTGAAALFLSASAFAGSETFASWRLTDTTEQARIELSSKVNSIAQKRKLEEAIVNSLDKLALTGLLTEALPDGYWLDQLVVDEDEMTITGYGPSAAEVTRILSQLPHLSKIEFASPVTRDNSQSLERFRISAVLTPAAL